jgi:hypothetical protein
MSTINDEIRAQLLNVVTILTPYVRGTVQFASLQDLRAAIGLALHAIEQAELLANYRLPRRAVTRRRW